MTQFDNVYAPDRRSLWRRALRRLVRSLWTWLRHPSRPQTAWAELHTTPVHPFFGTLLSGSEHIVVLGESHKLGLLNVHPEVEGKLTVIPPPPLVRVAPDPMLARERGRRIIGAGPGEFVLVYWGYIYPGKGVEYLLRAFEIVSCRDESLRLVLVGGDLEVPTKPSDPTSAEYATMIDRLPAELGIADRVTRTGGFSWDSDAGSMFLYAGDACVLPIDWGVTLTNSSLAAACTHGLPSIVTDAPTGWRDPEMEHGRNVFCCRPMDPVALADAIEALTRDAVLRDRLRKGAVELADKWNRWDTATQRTIEIFESALARRAG